MKTQNWPYLAGLFDGEGYIGISRNTRPARNGRASCVEFSPRIILVNTSLNLMKYLIAHFGGVYYSRQKIQNWKLSYGWEQKGAKNRENLLLGILPYLQVKREQAEILLEFIRMGSIANKEKREELYNKIKLLNRTGDSVETDTPSTSSEVKIQSELTSDRESAPNENSGSFTDLVSIAKNIKDNEELFRKIFPFVRL